MIEKLKFPANTMVFVEYIVGIATFDLYPTDYIDEKLYYLPEMYPFNINFEVIGIETTLLLTNIGSVLWNTCFAIILAIVSLAFIKVSCIWEKLGN